MDDIVTLDYGSGGKKTAALIEKLLLPALGNETITLLKETSIVTVIGLKDLTKGAMIIQGNTFQALVPFFAIAVIYLAMVMILTFIFNRIERRLRESDHR